MAVGVALLLVAGLGLFMAPRILNGGDDAMPIAREVHGVIHGGRSPRQAYRGLIRHKPGAEADPG